MNHATCLADNLQRIPQGMRPQINASFSTRCLRPTSRTDHGDRGSGRGRGTHTNGASLCYLYVRWTEIAADPLSTKLTHFMANGIHKKQQQKPKQSTRNADRKESELKERAWAWERERASANTKIGAVVKKNNINLLLLLLLFISVCLFSHSLYVCSAWRSPSLCVCVCAYVCCL